MYDSLSNMKMFSQYPTGHRPRRCDQSLKMIKCKLKRTVQGDRNAKENMDEKSRQRKILTMPISIIEYLSICCALPFHKFIEKISSLRDRLLSMHRDVTA
jgi:hypothetical protein